MGECRWEEAAQRYTECIDMQTASVKKQPTGGEEQPIGFKALNNRTQVKFRCCSFVNDVLPLSGLPN